MEIQPKLNSRRLLLRPFSLSDAQIVQSLAGDKLIADTTLLIPHPYPDGAAEEWISSHKNNFIKGDEIIFAIIMKEANKLIGAIGLTVTKMFNQAEMGYWIGVPFWNNGFATEAVGTVLQYAFDDLKLNKIHAHHMLHNQASGKVMLKNGMTQEGHLRKHIYKNGDYLDILVYGILRDEYLSNNNE